MFYVDSSRPGAASTSLSRGLFTAIAKALRERQGVDLGNCRHDLVLTALGRRLRARGQESLKAYAELIGADAVETRRLARALVPGESDLFQDSESIAVLSHRLAAAATLHETPRAWVVECGEGEEAYALAMRMHSQLTALETTVEFTVYGTESDAGALELAISGSLAPAFAHQLPATFAQDYTRRLPQGTELTHELLRFLSFREQDLLAPPPAGNLHIVIARNILRFLPSTTVRQLLEQWAAALKPGGLLLLGNGESLEGHEDLFAQRPLASGLFMRQTQPPPPRFTASIGAETGEPRGEDIANYRAAFASSTRPSAIFDADGCLLDVNRALSQLIGEPGPATSSAAPHPLAGRPLASLFADADRVTMQQLALQRTSSRIAPSVSRNAALRTAMGEQMVRVRLFPHAGPRIFGHLEIELLDADRQAKPADLQTLLAALEIMSEGLLVADDQGVVRTLNTVAQRLTGWTEEQAQGQRVSDLLPLVSPLGEPLPGPVEECLRSGMGLRLASQNTQLVTRDGRRLAVDLRASPVATGNGSQGVVVVFEDASQRLLLTEELTWRSTHDPITGLLNRDEFELRVRAALSRARQSGESSVLGMIDIDHFRLVNDVLGHAAGDEMLHELAGELRVRLRENDVLARLSGDEFGVLLTGYSLQEAEPVIQGLLEAARRYRFQWLDRNHPVTFSIGAAQLDRSSENVGRVISLADAACHAAKQAGRDRARLMGLDDEATLHHSEMRLVGQVSRAIEDGRLFLISEEVVSVRDPGKVVYRELLVRMRDEDGTLIKPSSFVPAAERYYLMSALDRWVISHAFHQIARSRAAATGEVIHAVNVSGQSLGDPEFLPFVLAELAASAVNPAIICFEITETTAISRMSDASRFIGELTARGCKFALDDFGVGMSSFSYLKNFPVHFLKIDGSFVRSMRDSQIDRGMVEAINRIGHQMGLKTIAEHVESAELLEPLRLMGVDWAQGHGISSAQPLDVTLK